MPPMVLLQHTLPDGKQHFDWLIAPDEGPHDDDDRVLLHFRCAERPDQITRTGGFEATKGETHRWRYLSYEGPVSGGRGSVRRIAHGNCEIVSSTDRRITLTVDWGLGPATWVGTSQRDDRWCFAVQP